MVGADSSVTRTGKNCESSLVSPLSTCLDGIAFGIASRNWPWYPLVHPVGIGQGVNSFSVLNTCVHIHWNAVYNQLENVYDRVSDHALSDGPFGHLHIDHKFLVPGIVLRAGVMPYLCMLNGHMGFISEDAAESSMSVRHLVEMSDVGMVASA